MNRRSAVLGTALALSLAALSLAALPVLAGAASAAAPGATTSDAPSDDAAQALSQLREDANGPVKVARDADGTVTSLSSTDGSAMLDSDATTPAGAVKETLADYGDAVGIDGDGSKAVVTKTLDSSTGGSVVRAQQTVDGLPVFGGQVVMSLDDDNDVTSVGAATTEATSVARTRVSEDQARRTAVAIVARDHHLPGASLHVVSLGERVYDPTLVHSVDRLGPRPVYQFTVGDGFDVRETVLVGAVRGEVALHFDDVPELSRKICDNANAQTFASDDDVPICPTAARGEGGAVNSVADVNAAYDNLGAVSQAYADLDGINLGNLIGYGSQKQLTATVRWCYSDLDCPFENAAWDGRQMIFGEGYAGADDVVGHELTHGYVERTSGLFYLYESGAINESVADTIGEIVDHRNNPAGTEDNSDWTLGEDLGDPSAERSMKDPTLHGQPDRTGSNLWGNQDADPGDPAADDGDVHLNDGVGNKTAYLISQGGSFNGQTITGIDGSDIGLAKTGRLYLETIPRLTSGADYAQLGRVLISTCQQLAARGTGGFATADCDSVTAAVAATGLEASPPSALGEAPITCPTDTSPHLVARDDDGINGFGFTSDSPLWGRVNGWSSSGASSLYAADPDPDQGDDASGYLLSKPLAVPRTTGGSFLNFHHTYILDSDSTGYYDGGQVLVQRLVNGAWTTVTGLPWVNGPDKHIVGSGAGFTGFGGDSHGYGSSQVDLTSLAGQTVRFVFRVEGDPSIAFLGWLIDDVRLYSCAVPAPSAPTSVGARAGTGSVVVTWHPPASAGRGVDGYLVSHGGVTRTVSAATRSVTFTGVATTMPQTFSVFAVAPDLTQGPGAAAVVYPTATSLASSKAKVKKKKPFVLTARVLRRGSSSAAPGVAVLLQRKAGSSWVNISSGTTSRSGTKAWTLKQSKSTYYRVLTRPGGLWFGSASAAKLVKKK